jgi:ankyrin repeat protein
MIKRYLTRTLCLLFVCCVTEATLFTPDAVAQETRGAHPAELPLHTAIAAGDLDAVRRLLQAGADPSAPVSVAGVDVRTPLSVALIDWPGSQAGADETVRLLLEAGANPNGVFNLWGVPGAEEPPLAYASLSPDRLRMLLEAGADPNTGWCSGGMQSTAMLMAEMAEQSESVALLRAAGAHRSGLELALERDPAAAALHAAVDEQDVARVKRLLEGGSDPNAALVGLRYADGRVDRVKPLSRALWGSDPGEGDAESRTALIGLLLAAGADANVPLDIACGLGSTTALFLAVANGEDGLAELLLEAGADPNMAAPGDLFGFTGAQLHPLIYAAGEGRTRMIKLLLDAGADPNVVSEGDGARFSALDVALSQQHAEIVDMLRARGAVAVTAAAGAAAPGDELSRDFASAFTSCTPESGFDSANPQLGVSVRYEIVGADGDACRVSLTYASNPNPEWERKQLLLSLDPRQPFMKEIAAGMASCAAAEAGRFNCAGPLLEVLRRDDDATSALYAAHESTVAVVHSRTYLGSGVALPSR